MNILVADDDQTMRELLDVALTQEEYQVQQTGNGTQTVEAIKKDRFDLVIMDYEMPDMTGMEVIQNLTDNEIELPPIIMLSAKGTVDVVRGCMGAGAKDFLVKPFTVPGLLERVNRQLK